MSKSFDSGENFVVADVAKNKSLSNVVNLESFQASIFAFNRFYSLFWRHLLAIRMALILGVVA